VVVLALAVFLVIGVIVVIAIPAGGATATQQTPFAVPTAGLESVAPGTPSAVELLIAVDAIDAPGGRLRLRLVTVPGKLLPAQGATVFTSVAATPSLVVRRDQIGHEQSAVLSFSSGDVADYPFDVYHATIDLAAVAGTNATELGARRIRMVIRGETGESDFNASVGLRLGPNGSVRITLRFVRTIASRGLTVAMMALYWAFALLAAGVAYVVIRRRRSWETRILSWLSALLFALVLFRRWRRRRHPSGPSSTSMLCSSPWGSLPWRSVRSWSSIWWSPAAASSHDSDDQIAGAVEASRYSCRTPAGSARPNSNGVRENAQSWRLEEIRSTTRRTRHCRAHTPGSRRPAVARAAIPSMSRPFSDCLRTRPSATGGMPLTSSRPVLRSG
jgi:hypothetical protein